SATARPSDCDLEVTPSHDAAVIASPVPTTQRRRANASVSVATPAQQRSTTGGRVKSRAGAAITVALAGAWAAVFATLALQRHLAGGSHAEDLGFTEQVLWNFLPPRL